MMNLYFKELILILKSKLQSNFLLSYLETVMRLYNLKSVNKINRENSNSQ